VSARVSIAVVSWNTRDLLARCLRSAERDHADGLADVVVVDNASSDGSAEMVAAEFPWVDLVASADNLGFGPAVNLAASRSSGEWLAIANADTALHDGALRALVDAGERDGHAGLIAPRLVLPDGSTQHSVHAFPNLLNTGLLNLAVERMSPAIADRLCVTGLWDDDRRRRVDWAHGAFLLARRSAFDAIGGFDPEQWMYAEDLDIAWRMRRAGWHTRYEPSARVSHAVSAATEQAWGDQRARRSMTATYEWIERRRGRPRAVAVALMNTAGTGVRAAAYGAAARVAGSDALAAEAARWRWHMRLHRAGLRRATPR
jgi:GT2 family glycosyltransferase